MLYKPWSPGVSHTKQPRYQIVLDCIYLPVLGSYNNWNIIKLTNKNTSSEYFDDIQKTLLDGISDNMESQLQTGKYGAIYTADLKNGMLWY